MQSNNVLTKRFPEEKIKVKEGSLEASLYRAAPPDSGPSLTHRSEIALLPMTLDEGTYETEIVLYSIPLPVRSWRELPGSRHRFPMYPAKAVVNGIPTPIEDFVSASILLFGAHQPVRVGEIQFGAIAGRAISSGIDMKIDFANETGYLPVECHLDIVLRLGPVTVRGDIESGIPTLEEALRLAEGCLNLADYEAPVIVQGLVQFHPRLTPI